MPLRIPPLWAVCALVGVVAVLGHAVLVPGSHVQGLVYHVGGSVAVGLAVIRITRLDREQRRPWLYLALGYVLFVVADLGPTALEVFGNVAASIGLLVLIRRRTLGRKGGGLIDAAIVTTAVAAVSWAYVIRPLAIGSGLDPLGAGHSLGFPLADLILMGIALALMTTPGIRSASLLALGVSLTLLFVADQIAAVQLLAGVSSQGGIADTLQLLSRVLFAVAAFHPTMCQLSARQPPVSTWLGRSRFIALGLSMVTGSMLFVLGPTEARTAIGIAAGTMSLLALLRLAGLVRLLELDVAQRRVLEEELTYQALHDPVTGLANRRRFIAEARDALSARHATGSIGALFIDLDGFKSVNDEFGHAAGDAALVHVASRIQGAIREGDLAARLGGDEFGVLLFGLDGPDRAVEIGKRIIDALGRPLQLPTGPVRVGASIGAAVDAGGLGGVDDLLVRADLAMYEAKTLGPDAVHLVVAGQAVRPPDNVRSLHGSRPAESPGRAASIPA